MYIFVSLDVEILATIMAKYKKKLLQECMLLLCVICVLEQFYTLQLAECQRTSCSEHHDV